MRNSNKVMQTSGVQRSFALRPINFLNDKIIFSYDMKWVIITARGIMQMNEYEVCPYAYSECSSGCSSFRGVLRPDSTAQVGHFYNVVLEKPCFPESACPSQHTWPLYVHTLAQVNVFMMKRVTIFIGNSRSIKRPSLLFLIPGTEKAVWL